jgi:hypothetical protein
MHHRFTDIWHAFGATNRYSTTVAIFRSLLTTHIAPIDDRGEFGFRCAAALPRFAVSVFAALVQLRCIDAKEAIFDAILRSEGIAIESAYRVSLPSSRFV